jgi:AraC family transcriptional regulator
MNGARTLEHGQFLGMTPRRFVGGGVSLAEVCHSSAAKLPRHVHRDAFFSLLLQGDYSEIGSATTRQIQPLSLTFALPEYEHADRIGPSGARFFTVSLDRDIMDAIEETKTVSQTINAWHQHEIVFVFLQLYVTLVANGEDLDPLAVQDHVVRALELVESPACAAERAPAWVHRAREHIHDTVEVPLSVIQLAQEAEVHPVHFSRIFRRTFGCGPTEYRACVRTHRACELLTTTALALADIAMRLGFTDQSHMTRVFKRRLGVSPGTYRELNTWGNHRRCSRLAHNPDIASGLRRSSIE